jgi:hypothetical protein
MDQNLEFEKEVLKSVFVRECKIVGDGNLDYLLASEGTGESVELKGGHNLNLAPAFKVLKAGLETMRQIRKVYREKFPDVLDLRVKIDGGEIAIKSSDPKIIAQVSKSLPNLLAELQRRAAQKGKGR